MHTQNSRKESFIGLSSSDDLKIALYYKEAFEILYKSNGYQDHITIPALFMVRQFLELGLKYNIRVLSSISGSRDLLTKLSSTHDFRKIHTSFLVHYKNAKINKGLSSLDDENMLIKIETLITKILPLDSGSMGYRYSEDKESNKLIELDERFNLEEVYNLLNDNEIETFFVSIESVFGLVDE